MQRLLTVVLRLAAVATALMVAAPAVAQPRPDAVRRLEQQLRTLDESMRIAVPSDRPISERLLLEAGGTLRFGFYSIDDTDGSTSILRQYDSRLFVRAELDGAHRVFGRLRFIYDDYNTGDSFDGRGDELVNPLVDRLWYEFDLRGAIASSTGVTPNYNLNVRAGKQYVSWGSGLTLSNVMYGAVVDAEFGGIGIVGLASVTAGHDTVDFDGSRPGYDRNTDREYYGLRIEHRANPRHRPYLFYLNQQDQNGSSALIAGPVGLIPVRFNYDSWYIGAGSRGSIGVGWRYHAEVVYEGGHGLTSPLDPTTLGAVAQQEAPISAFAGIAGLTYLVRDPNQSRVEFEVIAGSGDDDRLDSSATFGGNMAGTTDRAFNSLGYVQTGLALSPDPSNLLSLRASFSTFPFRSSPTFRNLRVGIDGYIFNKIDTDAPINVQTEDGRFVGGEIDLTLNWRLASDFTATLRYGVFLPGPAMPDNSGVLNFVYAGVTYEF